ncbi:MAG: flagellar motor switch protein FliG [Spirochaetaceae bacterium]|jgi:flagellar motor switch protein FliG|nr:flagellar motor switch protein FliG [Spirochaetaceae bacterium]
MKENEKRAMAAYQKSASCEENAGDDWLTRLAENDFAVLDTASARNKTPRRKEEAPGSKVVSRQQPSVQSPAAQPALEKITRAPAAHEDAAESKYRRVAKFLILIGAEQASKILENLDEEQVERISREISTIRGISSQEAASVLAEFHMLLSGSYQYGGAAQGGVDEARRLLYAAFGHDRGEALLKRSVQELDGGVFSFLEDFSGEQVLSLLRDETPATGALILSRLEPKLSAAVLSTAEEEWRQNVVRRIGRLGRVAPEILETVAESLREKARHVGKATTTDLDGMGALAAILKHTDISFGDKILNELATTDADLSRNIKERLFTLDDVVKAEDKPIQEKLRSMSVREIVLLVKGRPDMFSEKILSNISANRRVEVHAENGFLGTVTKKDSDEAIKAFMDWFRKEREEGAILMIGDELVE